MVQEKHSDQIGSAQFVDKNIVRCVNKDGKPMAPILETSVQAFIETKSKKGQIRDTTIIFANGQRKTVKEYKQELGMDTWWYRIRKRFFS